VHNAPRTIVARNLPSKVPALAMLPEIGNFAVHVSSFAVAVTAKALPTRYSSIALPSVLVLVTTTREEALPDLDLTSLAVIAENETLDALLGCTLRYIEHVPCACSVLCSFALSARIATCRLDCCIFRIRDLRSALLRGHDDD
jgi:hypothetical protein